MKYFHKIYYPWKGDEKHFSGVPLGSYAVREFEHAFVYLFYHLVEERRQSGRFCQYQQRYYFFPLHI